DGHGRPVSRRKLHGGSPSCPWTPRVYGWPPGPYGLSQAATPNTSTSPPVTATRAIRTRRASTGSTTGQPVGPSSFRNSGAGTIAISQAVASPISGTQAAEGAGVVGLARRPLLGLGGCEVQQILNSAAGALEHVPIGVFRYMNGLGGDD